MERATIEKVPTVDESRPSCPVWAPSGHRGTRSLPDEYRDQQAFVQNRDRTPKSSCYSPTWRLTLRNAFGCPS